LAALKNSSPIGDVSSNLTAELLVLALFYGWAGATRSSVGGLGGPSRYTLLGRCLRGVRPDRRENKDETCCYVPVGRPARD